MALADIQRILVDELKLANQRHWNEAVQRFGGSAQAEADEAIFLISLENFRIPIGNTRRPMLAELQRTAIEDTDDRGRSLNRQGGKYILIECVGSGGFGSVYSAIRRLPGQADELVAIKCIPIPKRDSIADLRLRREMELLCDVEAAKHPYARYVVKGIESFFEGREACLVMPFQSGKTLHEVIAEHNKAGRRLTIRQAMGLVDSVLKGATSLHGRGLIHRDIKPKNIIYDAATGSVCVVDLGIVKRTDAPVTEEDTQIGTPYYRPPECCGFAHTADASSDLYSIAATLYFLIAGEPPAFALFLDINPRKLSAKALADMQDWVVVSPPWSRTALDEIRAEVPKQIADLIFRTLEPARTHRPQNVAEFRKDFDSALMAIEHLRRIQKRLPAFRSGIHQAVIGVVAENEKRLYPIGRNARMFLSEVRRQLERGRKEFQVSPLLSRSDEFNDLLARVIRKLEAILQSIESGAASYVDDDVLPGRAFANDLEQFQQTLPGLLALQHQFSMVFAGVI